MLISLSPFGNLSRFVKQGQRVHETVLLLLDGDSIPCSGTILAARSPVFEKLVRENYEIHLYGFTGFAEQLGQCLELMYGGEVELDSTNIAIFLKFSVQFDINELLNLCAVWMENNNLFRESEQILNEQDKSKCLDIISCINFDKSTFDRNSYQNGFSSEEEYIDLEEICSSFSETTIKTEQTNGHTATIVSSRGRLAAELSALATPTHPTEPAKYPNSQQYTNEHSQNNQQYQSEYTNGHLASNQYKTNGHSKRTSPSLEKTNQAGEWTKVPTKTKLSVLNKTETETISKNPVTSFKPNLGKWSQFSSEDLLMLGSPLCPYPDFAKLEVALAWLANSELTSHQVQVLLDQFAENIDPLNLSDRYISLVSNYLASWDVSFPSHFKPHIRSSYITDDPGSKSKYFMHLWTLQRGDLAELRELNYVSFFAKCPLCDQGTGESVLKLVKETPCYDLKVDNYRRKRHKHGIEYPVHYHPNTVFHWLITTGSGSKPILHSLITTSLQGLQNILKKHDRLIITCLQLKSR
ncbi:hypothetical protein ACHWQZ_G008205 [Mnemiopsis leidyi]